ncbi:MAG: metalloregulator ArsR/SmtB family transcription factor [Fimbriimonadales bacterium]|jgi:ArsR family transcriptional regulator|nr:metalloregulator ArsR/SmtB family transcription factor [Fimbriimonadales bacterium]
MYRIVTFGKCFADPTAIRIIRVLLQTPITISELQEVLLLDRHTIDLRLTKLREAGLVKTKQQGRWLNYSISADALPIVQKVLHSFYDDVKWDPKCLADEERLKQLRNAN